MNHRAALLLTLTIILLASCSSQGQTVLPHDDDQIWNDVQLAVPLSKQVDYVLLGTLRLGRTFVNPVDERIGSGFVFKVGKYLSFQPAYIYIATQPVKGRIGGFENRLSFATTLRFPAGKFTVTDRNLFERRLRGPAGDSTRYRNRLQIDHPIASKKLRLAIFGYDEVFYDWSFNAWVRNRFALGVTKTFSKHFSQDYYFMRQNDGHSRPGNINAIGFAWRFRI